MVVAQLAMLTPLWAQPIRAWILPMPTIGNERSTVVRSILRALSVIRREVSLTWQAVVELPGALAGHRCELAQALAKNTAVMLFAQLSTTILLMLWIARVA